MRNQSLSGKQRTSQLTEVKITAQMVEEWVDQGGVSSNTPSDHLHQMQDKREEMKKKSLETKSLLASTTHVVVALTLAISILSFFLTLI